MPDLLSPGLRVDAYKNLNDECVSVLSREWGSDDYGLVIAHVDAVVLHDAEFVVGQDGKERVRRDGRKNVHAYARGILAGRETLPDGPKTEITYNPYAYDWFVTRDEERPVESADAVRITMDGGVATGLTYKFNETR